MSQLEETLAGNPGSETDRARWKVELFATLAVYFLPIIVRAVAMYGADVSKDSEPASVMYVSGIAQSLSFAGFAAFVIWSSREGGASFGLKRVRWLADFALALGLMIAFYIAYVACAMLIYAVVPSMYESVQGGYTFSAPVSGIDRAFATVYSMMNGATEEIFLWGIVFTRLQRLGVHGLVSVVVLSMLFASYHLYQGPMAAGGLLLLAIIHGVVFFLRPSLAPLIIAHVLWDMRIVLS